MIDKTKIPDLKMILFDLEGVIIKDEENISPGVLKSFEEFCFELKDRNFFTGIITGREEDWFIDKLRQIECVDILTSSIDKISQADKLLQKYNLDYKNVCFIGNEILDIPLLQKAGLSIAVKDSRREVKRIVDHTSKAANLQDMLNEIIKILDGD